MGDDFLLNSETARRLFHEHAETLPILDYHTHLSAADIAADRRFNDLYELWLEGDHYKWRAMRATGHSERLCTGDGIPYEKFMAWAATVPKTLRNPLYHWTHLELKRAFGINELLNVTSAPEIWRRANALLEERLTTRAILRKFNVDAVFTTDDPVDDLEAHRRILEEDSYDWPDGMRRRRYGIDVRPTFRPDRALDIGQPVVFLPWMRKLEEASNTEVRNLATFLDALGKRHSYFGELDCRASDHGLEQCPARPCSEETAGRIFDKALNKQPISEEEQEQYATFLMLFLAHLNSDRKNQWTMQLHLGARRNVNHRALHAMGPDTGFDAVGDYQQGAALAKFLDLLQRENAMPEMVLYNSNPADNHLFATLANTFYFTPWGEALDGHRSALQWGPPWWFLDQKQGIIDQLNTLSSMGLLSRFIGMTTDSRSFLSFPRHEYFRRILCDLIGGEVERGELPDDDEILGRLIASVCYHNAANFFRLRPPKV
ncbi:MAG TPA: glucuronate isomerase [Candidatus Eisenbacteria bacterium]|nr:glucuronate isomerase [Candidatus Eisenbacteria bacterium]